MSEILDLKVLAIRLTREVNTDRFETKRLAPQNSRTVHGADEPPTGLESSRNRPPTSITGLNFTHAVKRAPILKPTERLTKLVSCENLYVRSESVGCQDCITVCKPKQGRRGEGRYKGTKTHSQRDPISSKTLPTVNALLGVHSKKI